MSSPLTIVADQILELPLSVFAIDPSWNARSAGWQDDLDEMRISMLPEGPKGPVVQDVPVVARPIMDDERTDVRLPKDRRQLMEGKLLWLVSGFSRCECLRTIGEERKDDDPVVRVIVREMTEQQALAANIRENAARNNLRTADTAWQLWNLFQSYSARGRYKSPEELARMTACSVLQVERMLTVMAQGDEKMLTAWRNLRLSINVVDLLSIVKLPKFAQMDAFRELVKVETARRPFIRNVSRNSVRRAERIGYLLGNLVSMGLVTIHFVDFGKHIDILMGTKSNRGFCRKAELAEVMQRAFDQSRLGITIEELTDEQSDEKRLGELVEARIDGVQGWGHDSGQGDSNEEVFLPEENSDG